MSSKGRGGTWSCRPSSPVRNCSGRKFAMMLSSWPTLMKSPWSLMIVRSTRTALRRCALAMRSSYQPCAEDLATETEREIGEEHLEGGPVGANEAVALDARTRRLEIALAGTAPPSCSRPPPCRKATRQLGDPAASTPSGVPHPLFQGSGCPRVPFGPLGNSVVGLGPYAANHIVFTGRVNAVGEQHADQLALDVTPEAGSGEP